MKPRSVIKTLFDPPPIPGSQFDWCAWEDGYEEQGLYGYGSTEDAARADLLSRLAERE